MLVNAERTTDGATTAIRFLGIIVHNRKKFEDELVAARKTAEASLRENTALLELKQELQQRMEQLELHMRQARQQHSELMQFNRVVTHDLQEPIRKISIFSNMLVSVTDQDPKPMVEKLIRSLSHMRAIVSGLQQYVWLTETPTRLQMVHLPAMLLTAQQQLQQEVPDLDLVVECGDLPAVHADPDQLQVLLYHLLSNAFRFRKQNSTAVVTVQGILLQKNRFVAVKDQYRYEDHVQLTFTDNGQGFDPVYKEEVFRLFCRIHAESGRGVGLALCKKIMENHRGHISISTQPDKGSTVTLILPLSAETESVR